MKNIIAQVNSEAVEGFVFLLIILNMGLNMLVTTAPRTMTEINGNRSHPSIIAETEKRARKNHNIIQRDVFSSIFPPLRYHSLSYANTEAPLPL